MKPQSLALTSYYYVVCLCSFSASPGTNDKSEIDGETVNQDNFISHMEMDKYLPVDRKVEISPLSFDLKSIEKRDNTLKPILQKLLRTVNWDNIRVIHDNYFRDIIFYNTLFECVVSYHHVDLHRQDKNIRAQLENTFVAAASERKELHFVVFGERKLIAALLDQIQIQDGLQNQQGFFTFLHKWILITSCRTKLKDLERHLGIITHITIVHCIDLHTSMFQFDLEIYSGMWTPTGRHFELISTIHNNQSEDSTHSTSIFPNTKYHFNGQHLKIATQIWRGYIESIVANNKTLYYGPYYTLMQACSEFLNFTFDIVIPVHGSWGDKVNGEWNGIPALLSNKTANISIASFSILYDRTEVMDFVEVPVQYVTCVPLYRKPTPVSDMLYLYAQPFKTEVWIGIFAIMIVHSFLITIFSKLPNLTEHESNKSNFNIYGNILQNVFSSFLNQSVSLEIKRTSHAFLWVSWWVFSHIMVSIWSGLLMSYIVLKVYPWFPSTLEELARDSTHSIGLTGSSALAMLVKNSGSPEKQTLWRRIQDQYKTDPTVLSQDLDIHLWKVFNEDYLFFEDSHNVAILKSENCNLASKESIVLGAMYFMYSIGLQKHSAYRSLMRDFTYLVTEQGHMSWWLSHRNISRLQKSTKCMGTNQKNALKFKHFKEWFAILRLMIFVAFLVLVVECLLDRIPLYSANTCSQICEKLVCFTGWK